LPSFISLNDDVISVQTSNSSNAGNYTILMRGCDGTKVILFAYFIEIKQNTPPYLEIDKDSY